jgi:hypothetical protein
MHTDRATHARMGAEFPPLAAILQETGSLANQLATATAEERSAQESRLGEMRELEERMERMEEDMLLAQAETLGLRRKLIAADLSLEAAAARASAMEPMKEELQELGKRLRRAGEEAEQLRSAAVVSWPSCLALVRAISYYAVELVMLLFSHIVAPQMSRITCIMNQESTHNMI